MLFIQFKHQFARKYTWGSFLFFLNFSIFEYHFELYISTEHLFSISSAYLLGNSCGLPPNFPLFTGYHSDDGSPRRKRQTDMSVFRNAVEDCLDFHPEPVKKAPNLKKNEADVEKFSGLRIRWVYANSNSKLSGFFLLYTLLRLVGGNSNRENPFLHYEIV